MEATRRRIAAGLVAVMLAVAGAGCGGEQDASQEVEGSAEDETEGASQDIERDD